MSFLKWLDKNFEYLFLAFFLIVMTVLAFVNVVLRYVFKQPLGWSDEICCYCLALSAFFCLSCSIRQRSSIRVDTLTTILPKNVQKWLNVICGVIMIVFMCFCVMGGLEVAANAASVNQKSPALQIPVAGIYYLTTFCFVLSILRQVQAIILEIKGVKEEE